MSPAALLKILEKDKRVVVTASNIDAVRQINRDHRITLRRKHSMTPESAMKIYGVVNPIIDLPKSAEPQNGDFLHVNDVSPLRIPKKKTG